MLVEKLVKSGTACTNDNVNSLGFIFILSYFIFETCWAQICYVVEEDLEFLTLLSLLPECWELPEFNCIMAVQQWKLGGGTEDPYALSNFSMSLNIF